MLPSQISRSSAKSIRPRKPSSRHLGEESQRRYETIAANRKYRHFTKIPSRITRCLDYFGVDCDSVAVERRLRAYYLFIGVIDNAIDSGQWEVSQIVLRQFESPTGFDQASNISETVLVTERLLNEVSDETYPEVLSTLHALSAAVEHERKAASMAQYIEARKRVGQLTAKSSFLLIRPLLSTGSGRICHFMERVGEIGCLVDSVIDLNGDQRSGLLNFQSTRWEFILLLTCAVKSGAQFSIRHPRLLGLFLEAVIDILRDRPRAQDRFKRLPIPTKSAATTTP
ncbi:MAG TPA: hypothetical protein VFX97_15510 [Pyrinomonadaceae bacterium]|nr:hypothetical protein [Pyrinomonadaceae bacterium]